MKYYAYIPNKEGKEPCGTEGRVLFDAKTSHKSVLIKMVQNRLGLNVNYRLYSYTMIYRESTYQLIHEHKHT